MRSTVLVLLAACGSSPSQPSQPSQPAKPATTHWKDMDLEQKTAFMEKVVMPQTKALFVEYDAQKYAEMDCKTCHGDGVAMGDYEMPNPKIKPLPGTEEAFMAWISKDAEAAKMTGFMSQKLEPLMAKLLEKQAFDPATKTGDFSCNACHTLVK